MSDNINGKVFEVKDVEGFISSIRIECMKDILEGVSITFFGKYGKFNNILANEDMIKSFLPSSIIEDEIEKYLFSTTLHADRLFIKPENIELVIHDISTDLFDSVMMKMVDYNVLEICWFKDDFMWRIKPVKNGII